MNVNTNGSDDQGSGPAGRVVMDIRHLTEAELAKLGMAQIAYVRPVVVNGEAGFAIHAADGTPMALAGDRDMAIAAILQHDMVPVTVH
jgi:hypothetical protein